MQIKIKAALKAAISITAIAALSYPAAARDTRSAAKLSTAQIDAVARKSLNTFDTPGVAVGIVLDGKVQMLKGYGYRNLDTKQPVTKDTLFRIASTTKAFTSAALAILVDDGKLEWEDKVIDYLPDFRMMDPWVTREFTIRDLLTHQSGLGIGAGDLMLGPEPAGFTREEIMRNLRHLKPASSFRSKYAYDNLLYIVAGDVVAKASGSTWEEFVQTRILDPLGMPCYSGSVPESKLASTAIPYGMVEGKMAPITRNKIGTHVTVSAAAGGLVCNVDGMSIWMLTQMNGGVGPNGRRVFSEEQRNEMWKSRTILGVSKSERENDQTHFKTYALGWRKEDMHGHEVISHTGTLSGMQAYLSLIPELGLGVIVLNNGSDYGTRTAITQTVLKAYLDQPKEDWVEILNRSTPRESTDEPGDEYVGSGTVLKPLDAYKGRYTDAWYGPVDIEQDGAGLRFRSVKSVQMTGKMEPFDQNMFIIRWDNRSFEADAYARFETDFKGNITSIKLEAVSDETESSYNFWDLDFVKDEEKD